MIADGDGLEIEKHVKVLDKHGFFGGCVCWLQNVALNLGISAGGIAEST